MKDMQLANLDTDFVRDFNVIMTYSDVPRYQSYVFVMKHFNPDTSIDVLDMSVRATNSLKRSGVKTFGQLVECDLRKLRGCGKNTIKEINTRFISYVYDLYNDEQRKQFWRDTIDATRGFYKGGG
jgi:DNA-directed RNA polymerase alpha subunit